MDKIRIILGASVIVVFLMSTSATATIITRDVLIDLETDGSVIAFANQDAWEGIVWTSPEPTDTRIL